VAALFARSYGRAEDIHRAMLARGFAGEFRTLEPLRFRSADLWFGAAAILAPILIRIAVERAA
jgi:cobalt/nickel transport system permease protein